MKGTTVVAVIGDVVQSRQLEPEQRARVQADLDGLMSRINDRYRDAVLADFLITLGDEFQGLVRRPEAIPDIVQDLREQLPRTRFRIAVSFGQLTTPLKPVALGTDGPAWHAARALLDDWLKSKRDGVGFVGFGGDDVVLNALAGLLTFHWTHLEDSQREILTTLRGGEQKRKDVAAQLGISQQNLSNRAQAAGWREYSAGMQAWRELLERHPV
jgi:hypothetical protein